MLIRGISLFAPLFLCFQVNALTQKQHEHLKYMKDQIAGQSGIANTTAFNTTNPLYTGQSDLPAENVTLPLDHFGGNPATFSNRFWVAEDVYQPGGPVFLFDGGESDASLLVYDALQNDSVPLRQMLKQFNGMGIVWEHRYYGESLPGDVLTAGTDQADLQYLTAGQALEDVAYFARNFTRSNYTDLTPDKTPWIFVGASYPGARAAWIRNFYPDIIFASYAASAPVEARLDFSSYYDQVYRSMFANGFGNCTKDLIAAISYIDQILDKSPYNVGNDTSSSGKKVTALKELFLGRGYGDGSNYGFATLLGQDVPGQFQYFGIEGDSSGLSAGIRGFCDYIGSDEKNKTSGAEGWAKSKGAAWTVDRWASYGTCADGICGNGDGLVQDSDSIAWMWQTCTQFGYAQTANLGPHQIVSKYNSIESFLQMCQDQFSNASTTYLPATPDIDGTNSRLGGWAIRPSNVYWSNGEFDPWRSLSPMSDEPFSPKYPVTDQPAPGCLSNSSELASNSQDPGTVFGYILPNAEHGFDLIGKTGNYNEDLQNHSRQDFQGALKEWLKCFQPGQKEFNGTAGAGTLKPDTLAKQPPSTRKPGSSGAKSGDSGAKSGGARTSVGWLFSCIGMIGLMSAVV